jgi:hypothetical protein
MSKKRQPKTGESLRLEWRSPAELAENPRNWRRHPESQQAALAGVLSEVGWAGACLFNERTGRLIDGHLRRKVAQAQGAEKVPVLIGNWTEEQEAKILATLDPLAAMAEPNPAVLDQLLREVNTGCDELQQMLDDLWSDAQGQAIANTEPDPEDGTDSELDDDDNPEAEFLAPFPWFGGKARIAQVVWKRFGDVRGFIEPFFGSGACLLNRPLPFEGTETVNDFDGLVANFWRAVQSHPKEVARYADWPVNENDLHARHLWLVERKDSLQAKLEGDPDYCDPKIAGWWCWGMACWIGSEFCSGKGPWRVEEVDGVRQLVHLSDAGQGVNRQRVDLGKAGRGVNRKRVHLGNAGQGVNRQRVDLGNAGQGKPGRGECGLLAWMTALSERLERVRVCCGDWKRVCGGDTGDALHHFFAAGEPCGIFLDPPYTAEASRDPGCYRVDSLDVGRDVFKWAIEHGNDPRLRIALCGYEGEYDVPSTWSTVQWKTKGGMANVADSETQGKANAYRERVWFSPHCVK